MLPLDVARCIGNVVGNTYKLRLECLNCARRTAARAEMVVWREPPKEHPCPVRIAPVEEA